MPASSTAPTCFTRQRPPQAIVSLVKHLEAQGNELVSLEIATPSLEDVFIELTGRRLRD